MNLIITLLNASLHNSMTSSDALLLVFDFINLAQVHNYTVSAHGIFTFGRFSVSTVGFTGIKHVL